MWVLPLRVCADAVVRLMGYGCILRADILSLQQEDGSFFGDIWGEVDTRCAQPSPPEGCKTNELTRVALVRVTMMISLQVQLLCVSVAGHSGQAGSAGHRQDRRVCAEMQEL